MADAIDRRQFVGRTAFGAASLAASTVVGTANDKPSGRIVVGVMGLSRGQALATEFAQQPGVEVRYVCDVDSERVGRTIRVMEQAGFPKPQEVVDFRKILDDKNVDALICAAPDHWHAPATILACAAGKHVYVESPAATTRGRGS